MLAAAIILFREVFEMSIILGIVMAATRSIPGRGRWIGLGIAGGVLGSVTLAFFTAELSQLMHGMGQEFFSAIILLTAVSMIVWTVVWMQSHGKELSAKFKSTGHSVANGTLPIHALALLVGLSILREGAEIVLFMYGIAIGGQNSALEMLAGSIIGATSAAVIGILLYKGLVSISPKHFFSFTTVLLTLLACGMSAQAGGYLTAAGFIPEFFPKLWDTSHILSESSILGSTLHALIGYSDRPSGTNLVFYLTTLLLTISLMKSNRKAAA